MRRLHELERRLFPHRPQLASADFNPLHPNDVCQQIEQFLQLVSEQLFPVEKEFCWELDDLLVGPLQYIPLLPEGVDYNNYWGADGAFGPAGILDFLMCLAAPHMFATELSAADFLTQHYPDLPSLPSGFSLLDAQKMLDHMLLPAPLDGLSDVIDIVIASTGNPWLDFSHSDYYESFAAEEWDNIGNVMLLAAEWIDAQPILDKRARLLNWTATSDCVVSMFEDESQPDTALDNLHLRRLQTVLDTLIRAWQLHCGQLLLPLPEFGYAPITSDTASAAGAD